MNEFEKIAIEAQLSEMKRRLSEVCEFYGALTLRGPPRADLREAMSGYAQATHRIMDLLAAAVRGGHEPSARDHAEIDRNHRIRLAAMTRLMAIALLP